MVDGESGIAVDPICGKPVVEEESEATEYKRRRYFFCSGRCKQRFERMAEKIHVAELAKAGTLLSGRRASWGIA